MNKYKVSAVSYTNTKPFIYGISHSLVHSMIDLSLDIPSQCAQKFLNKEVDIALIPVGAMENITLSDIFSEYGIGATGAVGSVFILSNKPIEMIQTILLDSHSRTSNLLAKILLKYYWKQEVIFSTDLMPHQVDACVLIGDRTFEQKTNYQYVYDLSEIWYEYTQLPFVFAVWLANRDIEDSFKTQFNNALQKGVENIDKVVSICEPNVHIDLLDYLTHKLDLKLTEKHWQGMQLFFNLARTV